jgi:hypothetical protein
MGTPKHMSQHRRSSRSGIPRSSACDARSDCRVTRRRSCSRSGGACIEDEGIGRISAIGGRLTASRLVDAGLADDLYLSTTAREGGDAGTPWYAGEKPPVLEVVTRKRWLEHGEQIEFEHVAISGPEAVNGRAP